MKRLKVITTGLIPFTLTIHANGQTEPDMVRLPAACVEVGTLLMGLHASPLRTVCLDAFSIGRYEVTFREYDQFTLETGRARRHDVGFGRDDRPVIDVDWFDAVAYAEWLSEKTGKQYRLPTDAEWEYAARANAEIGFRYSWGAEVGDSLANCRSCGSLLSGRMTAPVGSFPANQFGIHDMHGNVGEWTANCEVAGKATDGNAADCQVGTVRGGSWDVEADQMVFWHLAPQRSNKPARDTGFRLVLEH
jgi:formylglycine-generating enzyme required for sulfatase activity